MFIEKLFVSKFYEQPDMIKALRRGLIAYLTVTGLLLLNFFGGLLWYNAVAVLVLGIALELLFMNFSRKRHDHQHKVQK
jgi:hypothetical protein